MATEPDRRVRATIVPHTHWDREWYAPFSEFRLRLVEMMDALVAACSAGFPHFHLDGQTAMVDDYLAVRPERECDVRQLASEGRLSLGPWVTQMDEFLTSGESHIRNLEMGLARAGELGPALRVGYMPDQFGHIGQMPQLLQQAGIERAVVWRGVPSSIDRDVFWWEAPDGSSVLTEYMAFGYFNAQRDGTPFDRIEEPAELADALEAAVDRHRPFMTSDRMLVMLGYDHAGPDVGFPERLDKARPMLRTVEATIEGIAGHLDGRRLLTDPPVWRGELRSSARAHLLPNVYSARVHQKTERGRVETLLERVAEPLDALVHGGVSEEELARAWTLLLWNGAHDSACGCSHDQVAMDVDARFAEARSIAERVAQGAMQELAGRMRHAGIVGFNPSPFERDGVPGLGWRVDPRGPGLLEETVELAVRDGWVHCRGVAFAFRDEPDVGDLYTFCPATEDQVASPPDALESNGDHVLATWDGMDLDVRVSRRRDEPFVRIEGSATNHRADHRLRLHVRLPHVVGSSIAGSPFELVSRALVGEGGDVEAASPTWPARHVVLAGDTALLHEGVFEYEVVSGREIAVTLLRCVGTISRLALATRPWPAGPDVPTPLAQMLGTTTFSLAAWRGADVDHLLERWERFALGPILARSEGGGALPDSGTLLDMDADAILSSIRAHNGATEVRLWNPSGDREARARIDTVDVRLPPAKIVTTTIEHDPRWLRRRV